jgi:glutamyl-tRNA(Gln) amidotransferase subunit E
LHARDNPHLFIFSHNLIITYINNPFQTIQIETNNIKADTKMDYKAIGLRCGLEIHQQLEGKKLFCNCPTLIVDEKTEKPTILVRRRLKAVIGETGAIDSAALHEEERGKAFLYGYYPGSCCLVDLDEEPPHPINRDALKTSFIVAKLLNANSVDEVQVMRKTVVDGSNTTGFQRTALIAMNGHIKTSDGEVSIPTLCIEEDAAKIVDRKADADEYNLSRLGIPLIEIATGPDIKTPELARETAEKLGLILRSTGKCKRGLGTIRQDVNISIKGGARIEIKGAQDLRMIAKLVEIEAGRQVILLKLREEIESCKVGREFSDLSDIFRSTESKVIKSALEKDGVVFGIKLPNFLGFIGREIQPGKRLGTEFSDYAKTKAGVGGIFHSDELPNYGITAEYIGKIRKELKCSAKDGFVIVADTKEKAKKALSAVAMRAEMVFDGIPEEVRKANADGTSTYMRPMPGGARMYPETDVVPQRLSFGDIKLPRLIEDKAAQYEEELGLSPDLAKAISKSDKNNLFEDLIGKLKNTKPAFVAEAIISYQKEVRNNSPKGDISLIEDSHLELVLSAVDKNEIAKSSIIPLLCDVSEGKKPDISKYKTASSSEIELKIKDIVDKNKGASIGALMGEVMKKFNGKVDGKVASEILRKYI